MAARALQPSEYEIQREVEALKDLRRRSTTPGALGIDPDLPNQPALWPVTASPSSSTEGDESLDHSDESAASLPPNNPADDPLHLFWVPASLHPEIAPAEFRAFLKEHARSPVDAQDDPSSSAPLQALSVSASISRKKSMLSRQYRPTEGDGVEHESVVPLKRNRSLLYPATQPSLTISDLRLLEELVEEAAESADPAALRSVLRRSLSLSIAPPGASCPCAPARSLTHPVQPQRSQTSTQTRPTHPSSCPRQARSCAAPPAPKSASRACRATAAATASPPRAAAPQSTPRPRRSSARRATSPPATTATPTCRPAATPSPTTARTAVRRAPSRTAKKPPSTMRTCATTTTTSRRSSLRLSCSRRPQHPRCSSSTKRRPSCTSRSRSV